MYMMNGYAVCPVCDCMELSWDILWGCDMGEMYQAGERLMCLNGCDVEGVKIYEAHPETLDGEPLPDETMPF